MTEQTYNEILQENKEFPEDHLYAELGKFIVEFEDLILQVRRLITGFFESERIIDTIRVDII